MAYREVTVYSGGYQFFRSSSSKVYRTGVEKMLALDGYFLRKGLRL